MTTLKTMKDRVKFLIARMAINPETQNFNQNKLAERCGMSKSSLSRHLSDRHHIMPKTLIKIARELNCSPEWLKNGKGSYEDSFSDYVFDSNTSPEENNVSIELYSKDVFEVIFKVKKEAMKNIFNYYQKFA